MTTITALLWFLYGQFFPALSRPPAPQPWYSGAWAAWRFTGLSAGTQEVTSLVGSRVMILGTTSGVDGYEPAIAADGLVFAGSWYNRASYQAAPPQNALTILVVIKPTTPTAWQRWVGLGSATNPRDDPGTWEYADVWGQPVFTFNWVPNTRSWVHTPTAGWHAYWFTIPGSAQNSIESAELYIDGVVKTVAQTFSYGAQYPRNGVHFGCDMSGTGAVLALWDSALDAATISSKHAALVADPALVSAGVLQ